MNYMDQGRMKKTETTSFGEYFDDQRDRIVKDMQTGKNTELYNAWREDFDKRQNALALLRKMKPASTGEQEIVKEMILKEMK